VANIEGLNGHYFSDCQETALPLYAKDERLAERLWTLSDRMIADVLGPNWLHEQEETSEVTGEKKKESLGLHDHGELKTESNAQKEDIGGDFGPITGCPGPGSHKHKENPSLTGQCPL
jgi:hypothetical protein